jgi:hypothetical protein
MILVCGGLADAVTELVCARLAERGFCFRLLDLAGYPDGYSIAWSWFDGAPTGIISCSDWSLRLEDVSGVYVRFLGAEGRIPMSGMEPEDAVALQTEADAGLAALIESLPCRVVNRVQGGMSNNSKPYQAFAIRASGLCPPPTLVTNDPSAARAFSDEYSGDVIYKSVSGVRSIVRRVGPTQLARMNLLRDGPAQLQSFIPGNNVRVHVVGDHLLAVKVETDAVDYRYAHLDGLSVSMETIKLPPEIHQSCLSVAENLDLLFAGIDLKVTPDGDWFCFEVNPCPGFLYYERHSGQPISSALADLLSGRTPLAARRARHAIN